MSKKAPFVAGNWKMHATLAEARVLVSAVVQAAPGLRNARMVVIPPFTALSEAAKLTAGTAVGLGGQNLHWEDQGAFTGEISGPMLKDAGCDFVVIGHSERRQFFGETDATVNKRVRAALRHGLTPILCVGESLEEREAGKTIDRIGDQLDEGLREVGLGDAERIVFAYEPVWAIGTGRTATPAQAEEVHAFIRGRLEEKYGKSAAACAIILYGGSVKPANAYTLYLEKDIDGFLVGGASLEADSFIRIASEALRASKEE
ncbi:MAG TPA: triose-phosphate isomerase [Acidobacteriota bacterium]|nr:triose-phosphate isomerase [Acidobacteriota bacterium]